MATAIEFNNISKLYRLGLVGTGTLGQDLKRWWTMNIRGEEDLEKSSGSVHAWTLGGISEDARYILGSVSF